VGANLERHLESLHVCNNLDVKLKHKKWVPAVCPCVLHLPPNGHGAELKDK